MKNRLKGHKINKRIASRLAGALGLLLTLCLFASTPVLAVPTMPHQFYGSVTIGSAQAPTGTVVTAKITGAPDATTTVDSSGNYNFQVPADDLDTSAVKEGGVAGDTIQFYIGTTAAQTSTFAYGGITQLNLSIGGAVALTADAGGPYSGVEGASIALAGSASGGTSPYTYAWDLDNDGAYDDATGANPSHSWSTAGTYTIGLRVTDNASDTATDTTTVTVTAEGGFDPYTYDEDEDGEFSKDEAMDAVDDYLAGDISLSSVLQVIILYFS